MNLKILFILCLAIGVYSFIKPVEPIDVLLDSANIVQADYQAGRQVVRSAGGADFDISRLAVPGKITVVDFYVDWCPTCKKLKNHYQQLIEVRPDVAIRRIKMKENWDQEWAKQQYGLDIRGTPHVVIFVQDGSILAADNDLQRQGYELLYQWMRSEIIKSRA